MSLSQQSVHRIAQGLSQDCPWCQLCLQSYLKYNWGRIYFSAHRNGYWVGLSFSEAVALRLSSVPCLMDLFTWQFGSSEGASKRDEVMIFQNLLLELTSYYSYCILFIRSKSLSSSLHTWRENYTREWTTGDRRSLGVILEAAYCAYIYEFICKDISVKRILRGS